MQIRNGDGRQVSCEGRSTPIVAAFVPGTLKRYRFSLEGGAELKAEAFACSDCGMVWTMVAYPENLREAVDRATKQK